ncbi:uncharacterized protein DS421_13g416640 [Arachis hypogaea]|nr:uncharacterized protein DS421_13g416640 [Arachis hypogaea]
MASSSASSSGSFFIFLFLRCADPRSLNDAILRRTPKRELSWPHLREAPPIFFYVVLTLVL